MSRVFSSELYRRIYCVCECVCVTEQQTDGTRRSKCELKEKDAGFFTLPHSLHSLPPPLKPSPMCFAALSFKQNEINGAVCYCCISVSGVNYQSVQGEYAHPLAIIQSLLTLLIH